MPFRTRTSATLTPKGEMKRDVLLRMMAFVWRHYKWSLLVVLACILVASLTSLVSSLFTRTLIDDYIVPLTQVANPEYGSLAQTLFKLGLVLLSGTVCSYAYNRLMVTVSQGTMLRLRKSIFERMEKLPLTYFDQRSQLGSGKVSDSVWPSVLPNPNKSICAEFLRSLNEVTIRKALSLNGTESLGGIKNSMARWKLGNESKHPAVSMLSRARRFSPLSAHRNRKSVKSVNLPLALRSPMMPEMAASPTLRMPPIPNRIWPFSFTENSYSDSLTSGPSTSRCMRLHSSIMKVTCLMSPNSLLSTAAINSAG